MSVKRKQHSADFKLKIAALALSGMKTISELSSAYEVHPTSDKRVEKTAEGERGLAFQNERQRENRCRREAAIGAV